jgi:HPt (histidine-containing phosphotransfer) domain-containing protein
MEHSPIWDHDALLKRMRGKSDRVARLVNLFLDDMRERIQILNEQVARQQLEEVHQTAHSIKGASANLSVIRLQLISAELEAAAKQLDSDKTEDLIELVNSTYQQAEAKLAAFIASQPN